MQRSVDMHELKCKHTKPLYGCDHLSPTQSHQNSARHRRIESDLEREEALHEKYAPLQKY